MRTKWKDRRKKMMWSSSKKCVWKRDRAAHCVMSSQSTMAVHWESVRDRAPEGVCACVVLEKELIHKSGELENVFSRFPQSSSDVTALVILLLKPSDLLSFFFHTCKCEQTHRCGLYAETDSMAIKIFSANSMLEDKLVLVMGIPDNSRTWSSDAVGEKGAEDFCASPFCVMYKCNYTHTHSKRNTILALPLGERCAGAHSYNSPPIL